MSKERLRSIVTSETNYKRVKNYCHVRNEPVYMFIDRLIDDWFRHNRDVVRKDVERFIDATNTEEAR